MKRAGKGAREERVHFRVKGEFITGIVRSLWNLEDQPERALKILKTLASGGSPISDAQCLEIVTGKMKLTGDSDTGLGFEPDDCPGKTLAQLIEGLKAERDEARDECADLIQMASGDTVIVASPTGARRIPRRKARRSGLSTQIGLRLEDGYDFDDLLDDPERQLQRKKGAAPLKPLRIWKQEADNYGATLPQPKPRPKPFESSAEGIAHITKEVEEEAVREAAEEAAEEAAARQRAKERLVPMQMITSDTGWLSPEGFFYPCSYSDHAKVAWALGFASHPQQHMVTPPGWIRMGESDGKIYFHEDHDGLPPTEIQKVRVREFCEAQKITGPWWLKEEENK